MQSHCKPPNMDHSLAKPWASRMAGHSACGPWSLSFGNGTLNIVANGSTVKVGDVMVDCQSITSVLTNLSAAVLISLAIIGCRLHGLIYNYLSTKPLGQESLMDIPNKLLFRLLQANAIMWAFLVISRRYIVDTGDVLAKIWMWPAYDLATLEILSLGLNPIIQIILVKNPSMVLPISDKTVYRLLVGISFMAFGAMNLICHLCRCWPPSYYSVRGMSPQFPLFQQIRDGFFVLEAVVCFAIRIFLKTKNSGPTSQRSTQILSNRVILFILVAMVIGLSLFHIFGLSQVMTLHFGSIMFFIVLPALLILDNPALNRHFCNRHNRLSQCCTLTKKVFIQTYHNLLELCSRRIQPHDNEPPMEMNVQTRP